MAENAFPLDRIIPVALLESSRIIFMAGKAETVCILFEEGLHIRSMVQVAAAASLFNWCMHIGSGKLLPVMTGEAHLRAGGFQQALIRTVMHRMAGETPAFGYRLVNSFLLALCFILPMTGKALLRRVLPEIRAADHAMMKMAGFTVVFLHRLMNDTLFEGCRHIGVAFHTAFPGLSHRLLAAGAGNEQTEDEYQSNK